MKYIVTLFWLIVACLVAFFTTMNSFSVVLHYPLGSMKIYFPLLLCLILIVGAILGLCALIPAFIYWKTHTMKFNSEIKRHRKEIDNLRTLPLTEQSP